MTFIEDRDLLLISSLSNLTATLSCLNDGTGTIFGIDLFCKQLNSCFLNNQSSAFTILGAIKQIAS